MSIDRSTAAALLAWASAFDNRTVTDESVQAWASALNPNVTIQDGQEAITEFFRNEGGDGSYLMIKHVNYYVSSLRSRRIDQVGDAEIPPDEIADDAAATLAWIRAYRRAIGNGYAPQQARATTNHLVGVSEQPKNLTERYTPGPGSDVLPRIASQATRDNPRPAKQTPKPATPAPKAPNRDEFMAQVADLGIPGMPTDEHAHTDPIQCPECGNFSAIPGETAEDGSLSKTAYTCNNALCRHTWVQTSARDGWLEYDQRDPRAPHAKTRDEADRVIASEKEISAARDAIGYTPPTSHRPRIGM